jgi:hypothetical protein
MVPDGIVSKGNYLRCIQSFFIFSYDESMTELERNRVILGCVSVPGAGQRDAAPYLPKWIANGI